MDVKGRETIGLWLLMHEQLDEFIQRVEDAEAGRLGKDAEASLRDEIYSAYSRDQKSMQAARVANDCPWPQVRAALRAYRDTLDHELAVANAQAGTISVSASANATADVGIALSNAMRAVEDSALTPEQIGEIQQMMLDTKRAATRGLEPFTRKASELIRKAGEYTAPIAEVIAIIQAAVQLLPPA